MMTTLLLCVDCQANGNTFDIRRRRLCRDCFVSYANSKVLKRMESYRFKNLAGDHRRKLLLPLSGGVSSLALLNVLDTQLRNQVLKRNRTAYDLVLVHVSVSIYDRNGNQDRDRHEDKITTWIGTLRTRFPAHYILPSYSLAVHCCEYDRSLEQDLGLLGLNRSSNEDDEQFISRSISSARTETARSDLQTILLRRLLTALAKSNECEAILWGHSDSRLAAQTLAAVGKGRGGSVPSALTEGQSSTGMNFNYPLRDLFHSELQLYLNLMDDDLIKCLFEDETTAQEPKSSVRNNSIDNLLNTYINSQGEKYPGIMANVVRTAGKLSTAKPMEQLTCRFCAAPVFRSVDPTTLCYGCNRMKQDIKT